MTMTAMDEVFQKERDLMSFAFSSAESAKDRATQILLADKREDLAKWQEQQAEEQAKGYMAFEVANNLLFSSGGGGGLLG